jgi:thiol-disulfide isomerase/thioredoxin
MEHEKTIFKNHGHIVVGLIITGVIAVASFALMIWDPWRAPPGKPTAAAATANKLEWHTDPKPAATTPFVDADGATHALADFHGQVLVVNFWATWCEPCVREMPTLDALQAQLGSDRFHVIVIDQDREGVKAAGPFLESRGLRDLTLYAEPALHFVKDAGLRGLPTSLVIDREGREVARLEGTATWDSPEMIAELRRLIGQP